VRKVRIKVCRFIFRFDLQKIAKFIIKDVKQSLDGVASVMFEAHSINAEHKDLIHDVAYDFYGQRMATCSSDQFVKVKMGFV
jgi:hypothetical protein